MTTYNKQWANNKLRFAIQQLKQAQTQRQLTNAIRINRNLQKHLTTKGFYWQTQRINNWIHYYLKPSALAESRSCVKSPEFVYQTNQNKKQEVEKC